MTGYLLVIFSLEVLIFFGIAIRILLIGQRPFLFNARWVLGVLVLGLSPLPVVLIPLGALSDATGGIIVLLILLLYVAIFVFAAMLTKRYYAMGVTEDSFRTAIHAALQELEVPFEETLAHIKLTSTLVHLKLTSLELDLQVSVHAREGAVGLKVKQSNGKQVLKEITKAIVNYYQTHETKMNNTAAIVFFVGGLAVLACTIILIQL
jgi:hypothetical protein